MLQVLLYPCAEDFDSKWEGRRQEGGRGPPCGAAADVHVTCRTFRGSDTMSAFPLLKPELGSALDEAVLRALDCLDIPVPHWFYWT